VNACGPSADRLRQLDEPGVAPLLRVSSGIHIVLPGRFAPRDGTGITIPKTEDGRVLFILPWLGGCLVGTTDEPALPCDNPAVTEDDVEYLLRHVARYFDLGLERSEIRSAWAGLRPLVQNLAAADTAQLARDHVISRSASGMITIVGGKWTTYRKMALDAVDYAVRVARLTPTKASRTDQVILAGGERFQPDAAPALASDFGISLESAWHLHRSYGDRAADVLELCRGVLSETLVSGHPYLKGEVLYAVRREMAVDLLDFLARRIPLALLDNEAALAAVPLVAEIMGGELRWDEIRLARECSEAYHRLRGAL
jgi:glycerol-3-phosphate dehydrogenase